MDNTSWTYRSKPFTPKIREVLPEGVKLNKAIPPPRSLFNKA